MKNNHNMEDLLGYMIGPKAENMEVFRQLVLEALDDHMYWRRNFHPEDKHVISAADQSKEGYKEFTNRLRDLMFEFLSEAKEGVPYQHSRSAIYSVKLDTINSISILALKLIVAYAIVV